MCAAAPVAVQRCACSIPSKKKTDILTATYQHLSTTSYKALHKTVLLGMQGAPAQHTVLVAPFTSATVLPPQYTTPMRYIHAGDASRNSYMQLHHRMDYKLHQTACINPKVCKQGKYLVQMFAARMHTHAERKASAQQTHPDNSPESGNFNAHLSTACWTTTSTHAHGQDRPTCICGILQSTATLSCSLTR